MSDQVVPYREARRVWVRVALQSFGGPAAQIAVMHRILVDEKRWIGEERFLHALNYCMLLPGPEAQQLATYIGWLLHGYRGGLTAGLLFVLPGFASILLLSVLYVQFHQTLWLGATLLGLKAAVLAVVIEALQHVSGRVARSPAGATLAVATFTALFFFKVPFPAVVAVAALAGWVLSRVQPDWLRVQPAPSSNDAAAPIVDRLAVAGAAEGKRPPAARSLRVAALLLTLWALPIAAAAALLGRESVFVDIGVFFSKTAVVTFGGAYTVLAYLAQQAVEHYHWLAPGEMLDGLGMAETTPGPLIQVVQFVGFLAAYRDPGAMAPMTAAVAGAALTTWVTFTPCFLWIFLGAPYIERLRNHRALTGALSAITAAVVGVISNLALWFSLHVLFAKVSEWRGPAGLRVAVPELGSLDPLALAITAGALLALLRWRLSMTATLLAAMAAGAMVHVLRIW